MNLNQLLTTEISINDLITNPYAIGFAIFVAWYFIGLLTRNLVANLIIQDIKLNRPTVLQNPKNEIFDEHSKSIMNIARITAPFSTILILIVIVITNIIANLNGLFHATIGKAQDKYLHKLKMKHIIPIQYYTEREKAGDFDRKNNKLVVYKIENKTKLYCCQNNHFMEENQIGKQIPNCFGSGHWQKLKFDTYEQTSKFVDEQFQGNLSF